MITKTCRGFIAEDLEESVAAPGTGDGVVVDGITVGIVVLTVITSASIIYDMLQN